MINGAVLAVTGIPDHEAFARSAEETFPDTMTAAPSVSFKLAYFGGYSTMPLRPESHTQPLRSRDWRPLP